MPAYRCLPPHAALLCRAAEGWWGQPAPTPRPPSVHPSPVRLSQQPASALPTPHATCALQVEAINGAGGKLSDLSATAAFYGRLATPAKPELVWVTGASAHAELRFTQLSPLPAGAPSGYAPECHLKLLDKAGTTAVPNFADVTISGTTGAGTGADPYDPYVFVLNGVPAGDYTAKLHCVDAALGATTQSADSELSAVEAFGEAGSGGARPGQRCSLSDFAAR